MKNMFKLDVDASGAVSFAELGNFLFKRHCGEMSLQKKHRDGKMSHGSERAMNQVEFRTLLNDAYAFLGVPASNDVTEYIFTKTDTDQDGLITYVQYFQVIEKYVCKDPNYPVSKSDTLIP
jgi:Ca2+-binding EF-hand superfamily protein